MFFSLTVAELDTAIATRDRAILLVGDASATRPGEVSALIWALDDWLQIRPSEPGVLITRVYRRNHPTV